MVLPSGRYEKEDLVIPNSKYSGRFYLMTDILVVCIEYNIEQIDC